MGLLLNEVFLAFEGLLDSLEFGFEIGEISDDFFAVRKGAHDIV